MSDYNFSDLKTLYENFSMPILDMEVNEKNVTEKGYAIIGANINISSGFEAGVATVNVANVFDKSNSSYLIDSLTSIFKLGAIVKLYAGYGGMIRNIFVGFISQISFSYFEEDIPVMNVTAMDIKGVMMNGLYNNQIVAKNYSEAIKEIFNKTAINKLTESAYKLNISDTPDSSQQNAEDSPFSVEMVNETDFEFVVRAAKRFNYEFFCVGEEVYFRKAKENKDILIDLGPEFLIRDFNVEYNISGLVSSIEVRGVDVGKGEVIIGKRKIKNKISTGTHVNDLIKDAAFVMQDPTITSDADAENRIDYLENEISNRFARLSMEFIGIPEVIPGRFIRLYALTSDLSDEFYVTSVTHSFGTETGFTTRIEATAPTISRWASAMPGL